MRNIVSQLSALARAKTAKHTYIVYFSQMSQGLIGLGISILLMRSLSQDDFAQFSVYVSTFMLVSGLSHWGWTETFVRFGSIAWASGRLAHVEPFFRYRIFKLSLVTAVGLALAAPLVARYFYERPQWVSLLWMAAATGWVTSLLSFEMNRVRVLERFPLYFWANVSGSLFRLAALGALAAWGAMRADTVMVIYLLHPILLVAFIWYSAPPALKEDIDESARLSREAGQYNRWLLLSIFATTMMTNLDVQVLAHFRPSDEVARLGAANRLTLPIGMLISALTTTLLPKLSVAAERPDALIFYWRKLRLLLPLLAGACLLGGLAAIPLLQWFAGPRYQGIGGLLVLQLGVILVALVTNPISLILHGRGKAQALARMNLGQFGLALLLFPLLVQNFGAVGSILTNLCINLTGFVVVAILTRKEIRFLAGGVK